MRSTKRQPFAETISRPERRVAGRTWAARTALAVRTSGVSVTPALREHVLRRLGWRLGKFAPHIERLTVRFDDLNGPRGGIDTTCRIKVVIAGLPSVVVTERAESAVQAFNRADDRVERAVRRSIGRAQGGGRLRGVRAPVPAAAPRDEGEAGVARPPAPATARNFKRRTRKATVALEASARSRPSRKSTRGSANRAKHANKLARRERRRVSSSTARRARAATKA